MSKNPFRSPGTQAVAQARPSSPPLPPLPPPSPTGGPSSQPGTSASASRAVPPDIITEDIDEDDLPPPYTPAANSGIGEETIGVGPRRPFQPAPPAPSSLQPPPPSRQPSTWTSPSQLTAQPYASGPNPYGMQSQPSSAPWQTNQQSRQRQHGGGGLLGTLFDTVREIADAVSGVHEERMMLAQRANAAAYASPHPDYDTGPVYAPPPGPPRPASTPPRTPSSAVPDDGTPTRTPVPGHPLLRDGNLLVYPRDHLCVKCKNTGYKNYDPSNPCRKCWEKYGKPYTGALTYTPWSASGNDHRMQRPLPKFVPPHLAGLSSPGSGSRSGTYPPPPQHPYHTRSISQPHSGGGASYYVMNPLSPDPTPPVPDAIPVNPGDPRLGGRLCQGCYGAGYQTVMLIDMAMCDECGGTGRVWR